MARVQLVIPDDDRDRFVDQARREGMTLSAWLRAAAEARLRQRESTASFRSRSELREFFAACDAEAGAGLEPEWDQHLEVMAASRRGGTSST